MGTRERRAMPGPNVHLIGRPGAAAQMSTPCLVLARPAFDRNIAAAAQHCRAAGLALRPHAKTHKSSAVARAQIEAGAAGLCVATVGEAEAMAAAGIDDILITSTFTQPAKIGRVVALARTGVRLTVVLDDAGIAAQLAQAAAQAGIVLPALIDVDLGRHRNGVSSEAGALAVASAIASLPALRLDGIQAYASHISHLAGFAERLDASRTCAAVIAQIRSALNAAGHPVRIVSGGSTGTLFIDTALDTYTELQCGSYVFSDVEYAGIEITSDGRPPFEPALVVRVSVIGRNWPGRVTCDGGNKHFSSRGTLPAFHAPPARGAVYRPDSDEHGIIELPDGAPQPALGTSFDLVVPHCDPTVNLFDAYHVVENGTLVDVWPIEARGAY
mgnify:CR=1 FL=1